VDAVRGVAIKSHQIAGWEDFAIVDWCQRTLRVPADVGNDSDVAALAEARYGAGRGRRIVFYVTVGTGVGGGCVIDGQLLGHGRPAVAEIGHLRPGLDAVDPRTTVESLASGWGIASSVRAAIAEREGEGSQDVADLLARCQSDPSRLSAEAIVDAAREGNRLAASALARACRALGWGIAQAITLLAPEVVVIGGGVSLAGEELFLGPVRACVRQYAFPPLAGSCEIVPSFLGERVVVHGAIAIAAEPETALAVRPSHEP
jgi:glucokinase